MSSGISRSIYKSNSQKLSAVIGKKKTSPSHQQISSPIIQEIAFSLHSESTRQSKDDCGLSYHSFMKSKHGFP